MSINCLAPGAPASTGSNPAHDAILPGLAGLGNRRAGFPDFVVYLTRQNQTEGGKR